MSELVTRPTASEDKISHKSDFELCYIRHQYFRRANYNPTEAEMQPYIKIIEHFTKKTFFTYENLFKVIGLYHDDILNIGRVHVVSFLGLYALERMDKKREEFVDSFREHNFKDPEEKDFDQKNKANFTTFFKQRMEDLVRVCRQKVRNIKGKPSEEFTVFCGPNKPPKYHRKLLKEYEDFGYKKIDFAIFKSIRRKSGVNQDATIFLFDNVWYVAIPLEQRPLSLEDIVGSGWNPMENVHNMQPDDLYNESEFDQNCKMFENKSNNKKILIIKKFIARNKNKAQYKEEINTARKLLRHLEA